VGDVSCDLILQELPLDLKNGVEDLPILMEISGKLLPMVPDDIQAGPLDILLSDSPQFFTSRARSKDINNPLYLYL
jgi:hypothetical protein